MAAGLAMQNIIEKENLEKIQERLQDKS